MNPELGQGFNPGGRESGRSRDPCPPGVTGHHHHGDRHQMKVLAVGFVTLILLAIVVLAVGVLLVTSIKLNTLDGALMGAAENQNQCSSDPSKCQRVNATPAAPTVFPASGFSDSIAVFTGQLVSNLEYIMALLAQAENVDTNIPTAETFAGEDKKKKVKDLEAHRAAVMATIHSGVKGTNEEVYGILSPLVFIDTIQTTYQQVPVIGYAANDPVNNVLYLVFRGTISSQEWSADLQFQQSVLPTSSFGSGAANCLVHSGFLTVFQQFQAKIDSVLASNAQPIVVVTGHSLGGALASLVTLYLAATAAPTRQISMYAFGKPRVGNVEFANYMNSLLPGTLNRIENENDVITQLPLPSQPNTTQFNLPWTYQHEGESTRFSSNVGSLYLDHSMSCYLSWLYGEL